MKPYSENKNLTVIEMLSGPGAGKSCAALFLAAHMKARGFKVEYVREIPKDLVWDGRTPSNDPNLPDHSMMTEQDFILAHQNNLLRRMLAHDIEYVVTDTSMLLGLVYAPPWYPPSFETFLLDIHSSYNNITFYVDRGDIPYVEAGRNETELEAKTKDLEVLRKIVDTYNIPVFEIYQKAGKYDHGALQMLAHIQERME